MRNPFRYFNSSPEVVFGGDKLDHGSGGFSFRGRSKTLPPALSVTVNARQR
jgi:hypothetical protein